MKVITLTPRTHFSDSFKCSRFFGEPVVEACVEGGAHHVDISGEPQYLEKMQLKYHQVTMDVVRSEKKIPSESFGERSLCGWSLRF